MSYTPPATTEINFNLVSYTPPVSANINFGLLPETKKHLVTQAGYYLTFNNMLITIK